MIQAIETIYNGHKFRSRGEARTAVFFDSLGEPWEYEKEGYKLPSGWYLPDFWLPRLGLWVECKGKPPTPEEARLCAELSEATYAPAAIAIGLPYHAACDTKARRWPYKAERLEVFCGFKYAEGCGDGWEYRCFWAMDSEGKLCVCTNEDLRDVVYLVDAHTTFRPFPGIQPISGITGPIDLRHVHAASMARFEHGETPCLRTVGCGPAAKWDTPHGFIEVHRAATKVTDLAADAQTACLIRADGTNTHAIFLGGPDITSDYSNTGGIPLLPGDACSLPGIGRAIYAVAAIEGQHLSYVAFPRIEQGAVGTSGPEGFCSARPTGYWPQPNPTKQTAPGDLLNWRGGWDGRHTYQINDCVSFCGMSYIAVANHENSQPPSSNWALLAFKNDGPRPVAYLGSK